MGRSTSVESTSMVCVFIACAFTACISLQISVSKKAAIHELPPISYVQEMGGSSHAGDYDSAAC